MDFLPDTAEKSDSGFVSGYIDAEPSDGLDPGMFIEKYPGRLVSCNWLVDLENTQGMWEKAVPAMETGDRVFFFWTENCPKLPIKGLMALQEKGVTFFFRECGTGHNGLDFQLSSELGWLAASGDKRSFVVLSDDHGYDVLFDYWKKKGVPVKRMATGNTLPESKDILKAESLSKTKKKKLKAKMKKMTVEEQRSLTLGIWKDMLADIFRDDPDKKQIVAHFLGVMKAVSASPGKKARMRRIYADTVNRFGEKSGHKLYTLAYEKIYAVMKEDRPLPGV